MGKMKSHTYEHELCDPDVQGRLIQIFDDIHNLDGVRFPYGVVCRIVGIEYDAPIQIPIVILENESGDRIMLTTYDLPTGKYRLLPEGKLTDVLYRE